MADPDTELIAAIRAALAERADPVRAAGAQRYMKSSQPFYGVRVPEVRQLTHALVRNRPPGDLDALRATVLCLWDGATRREERYSALAILASRAGRELLDPSLLDLHRHLLITGAWWDLVDETAHRVEEVWQRWPGRAAPVLRSWAGDPDMWVRRCAIIAQLGAKERTDRTLLTEVIETNSSDPEFFIRKAIGWALRQYARTDPRWVSDFVRAHRDTLSPLSIREATKHLPPGSGA